MGIKISGSMILASASPRRIELLRVMGLHFDVIPGNIDEAFRPDENPREHVLRLSEEKTCSVAGLNQDAWVIGADTIVVVEGEVLGKPRSREDAADMLNKLSGRGHEVLTGFCIVRRDRGILINDVVRSEVFFRTIEPDELSWYTGTEEPYDKAGAYAMQGMGSCFVSRVNGSSTNVIGLPLCEVVEALKKVGAINFAHTP